MCRNPETTAPPTTFATISTATRMPSTPNAIRYGAYARALPPIRCLSARYVCDPASEPGGNSRVTSASRARSPRSDAASRNRNSICRPVGCSAPICSGATQASAV